MSNAVTEDANSSSKDLLTKEIVAQVFKADKGQNAELLSFEIKDFTKKGDNYASYVTSVICKGTCEGQDVEGNYVVKAPSGIGVANFLQFLNMIFVREGSFYTKVLPKLNEVLSHFQMKLNCFPECLYTCYDFNKELLFSKNLRIHDFRMFDRTQGLPEAEVLISLGTLAKFHAASFIVKTHCKASLLELFPVFETCLFEEGSPMTETYWDVVSKSIEQSAEMLERVEGREKALKWLKNSKEELVAKCFSFFRGSDYKKKFECILHGDFWNNNMLFR